MLVLTTMQASHVSRIGPFSNGGLLHRNTLTNRHQHRHTLRIHAVRLLHTKLVLHSGASKVALDFCSALGREHHISLEERTCPSKLSASSDTHTHTHDSDHHECQHHIVDSRQVFLTDTLHSDFRALQEDTHGWTARAGQCALMVPVKRLASTRQTFVKQTIWGKRRGAGHGRPLSRPNRDLLLDGLLEESVHLSPHSVSNPVAVLSSVIMARTHHAMMRRGRNQADQHVLVRGGCDQGERLMPAVGRVFFERARE